MGKRDFDVIVVGSGAAGLSAAVAASDAEVRVLLCEAGDRLGGSSANSGGMFYAAGTRMQREQGIVDSPDDLYHHFMLMNRFEIEPAVARRFADDGAGALDWLVSLGVEFNSQLFTAGYAKVPRGHLPKDFGFGLTQALGAAVSRGNIEVALNTRVEKLLTDASGGIAGIRADGVDVTAYAVVMACGGVGAATTEMRRTYFPNAAMHGEDWHFYIGVATNRGDAIRMGEDIGAEIVGHNSGLMISAAQYHKNTEGQLPGWPVYVNKLGRRFINEMEEYSIISHNANRQPDSVYFAILDHDAFTRSPKDPRYQFKAIFSEARAPSFDPDWMAEGLKHGMLFRAPSLEELALEASIKPETLVATIEEYNRDAKRGHDSHFLKDPVLMVPVVKPPFYAIPRRAAQISVSSVGLHIDANAQVYSRSGGYVGGLFAAGEASGGVWNQLVASGTPIANCIIFGRAAGRSAAAFCSARAAESSSASSGQVATP